MALQRKTVVVSVTAKFYDPMGFLSPIVTEFKIAALVLQFVKILKLRLQKNVETQKELTSQDIAVAEKLWIKEYRSL